MDLGPATIIVTSSLVAAVAIVKLLVDASIRWRELHTINPTPELERRLERIELALESIACEIERTGEAQRFAARLSPPKPDASASRVVRVTPPD